MTDRRRECDGRPPFCPPATTPHFFKIIPNDTSKDTKLRFPCKFVEKYGGELSHSACLKLRDGLEWEVEITRHDHKAWFENGWPMFANFYSLDHGHFLVFGYEGNSKFNVCIFDKTATEIQYPITVEDDDSSCEILEYCPRGSRNPGDESPIQGSLCKKNRKRSAGKSEINPNIQMDVDADDEYEENDEGSEAGKDEDNHLSDDHAYTEDEDGKDDTGNEDNDSNDEEAQNFLNERLEVPRRTHPVTTSTQKEALQRAKAYNPLHPHFVAAINPSSMLGGYLHVPSVFGKTYLVKQPTHVMLQTVSNNGTWSVDMHYDKLGSRLRAGWLAFVKSNNLSVGDACVFVLKDNNEFLFEVVFYQARHRGC